MPKLQLGRLRVQGTLRVWECRCVQALEPKWFKPFPSMADEDTLPPAGEGVSVPTGLEG